MDTKVFTLSGSPIQVDVFKKKDWKYIETIYHERYTTVDKYQNIRLNQIGALKVYSKKGLTTKELERRKKYIEIEIECNKVMDGEKNILPLWFYYETEHEWGLMTKYMTQSTLGNYLYKYSSNHCIITEVIYPLLSALYRLHIRDIVHRDLKPDNIFVHKKQIYVGDFGYSCILHNSHKANGFVGTLQYMAPELLYSFIEQDHSLEYGMEVDIWAVGIITYELFYHRKPFGWSGYRNLCETNPTKPEFIKKCLLTDLEFPHPISEDAKNFIQQCLKSDPYTRPSIRELLHHPWIVNHLRSKRDENEKCPLELNLTQIPKEPSAAKTHYKKHQKKLPSKTHCTIS